MARHGFPSRSTGRAGWVSRRDWEKGRFICVPAIALGVAVAVGVVVCGVGLTGLVVMLTGIERDVNLAVESFGYLSTALGSFYAGRRAGFRGWVHGGITGVVYYLLVAAIFGDGFESLIGRASVDSMLRIAISFALGAIGGAAGVNM